MQVTASEPRRSRRGWCCCGCLALLILLIVAIPAGIFFGPAALNVIGLGPPDAEELFSGSPDPFATGTVSTILEDSGVTGVDVYVIPITGSEDQIAIFTVDDNAAASGITSAEDAERFLTDLMGQISNANNEAGLGINHVAVDYLDESGQSLLTFAAPQSAVEAYANGTITRQAFLAQVDIDYSKVISSAQLRELLQEVQ